MIHEKQDFISYGFIDMNGKAWPDQWIDTYNNFTRDINKSAGFEVKADSLTQKERDFFLDNRHKFYCACSGNQGF